jgi:hypothetical protein
MEENPHIHTLVTEVSFPSSFVKLAHDSKHLTPALLNEELKHCKREDFTVCAMHLKALFAPTIIHELTTLGLLKNGGKILSDSDNIAF